jgi:hypothetical protein
VNNEWIRMLLVAVVVVYASNRVSTVRRLIG